MSAYSQSCGFSSGHVWMWKLDHKEDWALKNWCCWIGLLEKTLESPLDCKDIKPVNPKGNQLWIFIIRTDVETEAPIVWPHDTNSQFTEKDLDAGKDWGQERKRVVEDEMVNSITNSMDLNVSKPCEIAEDRGAWHAAVHGVGKSWIGLTG